MSNDHFSDKIPRSVSLESRGLSYIVDKDGNKACVGKGASGTVNLVISRQKVYYVAKELSILRMSPRDQIAAEREVDILRGIDHAFIIKFMDCFINPSATLFIVMEYADGGDLAQRIKQQVERKESFQESQILSWFVQLCMALDFLHSNKILHRDLKALNVFLNSDNVVKLGDFGFSKQIPNSGYAQTVCGTPYYFSPEICNSQPYSNKSDVWSLGIILYELTTLKVPFNAPFLKTLMQNIAKGNYAPLPPSVPSTLQNLIRTVLVREVPLRPSVGKILQIPYLQPYVQNVKQLLAARRPVPPFSPMDPAASNQAKTPTTPVSGSSGVPSSDTEIYTNSEDEGEDLTSVAEGAPPQPDSFEFSVINPMDQSSFRKLKSLRERLVDALGETKVIGAVDAIKNTSILMEAPGEGGTVQANALYAALSSAMLTNEDIIRHQRNLIKLAMSELRFALDQHE